MGFIMFRLNTIILKFELFLAAYSFGQRRLVLLLQDLAIVLRENNNP